MARSWSNRFCAPLMLAVMAATLCTAGCGGCQSGAANNAAQNKAKKQAKGDEDKAPKEALELGPVTPLLSELLGATDAKGSLRLAKPGHWTATVQRMTANEDNYEGRTTVAAVDARDRPLAPGNAPFSLVSSRPAILAKGRAKRVLCEILPPAQSGPLRVWSSVTGGDAGSLERRDNWSLMPSNQYFFLVLAREPSRYAYLKVADTIRAPYEHDSGEPGPPHYRVVLADAAKRLPLPENALEWTSVAYVVWDEVNPARLSPQQQQALVDWLHWGGRLIVSGPDSLATLRGSFLDAHLPVDMGKSATFDDSDLETFNAMWTGRTGGKTLPPVKTTRDWSGIALTPRSGRGRALPGADSLFYEGQVGAGSIVVSGMHLTERDLVNWRGFDGFLNSALLRRPSRTFQVEEGGLYVGLRTIWSRPAYADRAQDAHFTTPLRWFARDARTKANVRNLPAMATTVAPMFGQSVAIPEPQLVVDRPGGLGAWNDFSPASNAAREALREAAGVRVPGSAFIVVCLALYLIILVPLNWMLFHALGRIEWAWIAAPLIALAGAFAVVRQAQLDIGFVRSQTEIALVELQGDHSRGHLSRYMALYSSLSTTYDAEFASPTAVAMPFSADTPAADAAELAEGLPSVALENYDQPRLRGVPVVSASTQLLHSEEILPLAGPLRLTSPSSNPYALQIENRTGLDLSDAAIVRRTFDAQGVAKVDGCWLGTLRNGAAQLLPLGRLDLSLKDLPYAADRAKAAAVDHRKRLNVDPLLKTAFTFPSAGDPHYARRGEVRLVARIDAPLPGAVTEPAASQVTGATVVLAHLRYDPPPMPEADANSPGDVKNERAADEGDADGVL